jgi:hypothetical protein
MRVWAGRKNLDGFLILPKIQKTGRMLVIAWGLWMIAFIGEIER